MFALPAQTIGDLKILAKVYADEFRQGRRRDGIEVARESALANLLASIDRVAAGDEAGSDV